MESTSTCHQRSPGPEEQRVSPRFRVTYRVEAKCGSRTLAGHTTDVNAWGLFLETREMLEPGSRVRLSFAVGASAHDLVEAHGRVVRRVTPDAMARTGETPGLGIEIDRYLWGQDRFAAAYEGFLTDKRVTGLTAIARRRRSTAGVPVGLPIYWGDGSGAPDRAGFMTNLSKSGAFFVEGPPVPPGSRLQLWFEVPLDGRVERVRAVATVVRMVHGSTTDPGGAPSGMGIRLETSTLDSRILEEFLDDRLQGGESRAAERRYRGRFSSDIDKLVLEALAELDREEPSAVSVPDDRATGAAGRYRLVEIERSRRAVDWARVASMTFRGVMTLTVTLIGLTLVEVLGML